MGSRSVFAHWNGRYRISENRLLHEMDVVWSLGMPRYVARHVPCHSNVSGLALVACQNISQLIIMSIVNDVDSSDK